MTLSADDLLTLVEVGVVLFGVALTWFVYRPRPGDAVGRAAQRVNEPTHHAESRSKRPE